MMLGLSNSAKNVGAGRCIDADNAGVVAGCSRSLLADMILECKSECECDASCDEL